ILVKFFGHVRRFSHLLKRNKTWDTSNRIKTIVVDALRSAFAISLRLDIGGLSSRMHSIAAIVTQDQQKVMRRTTREHRR
ncbi:hypothetical protein QP888_10980, partial [Corynebacterium sp. MSK297]|nr:hypothetical protein [Corynebacterium sp. MSK297]